MDWKGRVAVGACAGLMASVSQANLLIGAFTKPSVGMARQSNIVIWDPKTKIEHLVRSTAFASNTKKFDIVTPTPTLPTVERVDYHSFRSLYEMMYPQPKPRQVEGTNAGLTLASGRSSKKIEVAQIARIGNFVATTIRAADVLALSKWLETNGYKPNAAQNKWLEKYVQKRWYLTALKVETDAEMFETEAVRLSFKTEVPVDPYYTPSRSWLRGVRQELYVVTPNKMQGYLGAKTPWKANTDRHAFLTKEAAANLAKELKLNVKDIPAKAWVHRYMDMSADSNTIDDIYFYPTPSRPVSAPISKKPSVRLSK